MFLKNTVGKDVIFRKLDNFEISYDYGDTLLV
jgi:hypothetical protein